MPVRLRDGREDLAALPLLRLGRTRTSRARGTAPSGMRELIERIEAATPNHRDRAVEALRALAVLGAVLGQWLVTAMTVLLRLSLFAVSLTACRAAFRTYERRRRGRTTVVREGRPSCDCEAHRA